MTAYLQFSVDIHISFCPLFVFRPSPEFSGRAFSRSYLVKDRLLISSFAGIICHLVFSVVIYLENVSSTLSSGVPPEKLICQCIRFSQTDSLTLVPLSNHHSWYWQWKWKKKCWYIWGRWAGLPLCMIVTYLVISIAVCCLMTHVMKFNTKIHHPFIYFLLWNLH